jgi:hypothetical protein
MVSAKIRVQIGKTWIEVDANSVKEAIQGLSEYTEVFSQGECGLCQSHEVAPMHREAQGFSFYEMTCLSCGARLSFGQTREGGRLFPKRKDKDGNPIGNWGWHKFQKDDGHF